MDILTRAWAAYKNRFDLILCVAIANEIITLGAQLVLSRFDSLSLNDFFVRINEHPDQLFAIATEHWPLMITILLSIILNLWLATVAVAILLNDQRPLGTHLLDCLKRFPAILLVSGSIGVVALVGLIGFGIPSVIFMTYTMYAAPLLVLQSNRFSFKESFVGSMMLVRGAFWKSFGVFWGTTLGIFFVTSVWMSLTDSVYQYPVARFVIHVGAHAIGCFSAVVIAAYGLKALRAKTE